MPTGKLLSPTEAATRDVLCKKVFLEIFNSQENFTGFRPATLLKKRLLHRCFPVNLVKFLRIPFLQNTSGQLLLLVSFEPVHTLLEGDSLSGTVSSYNLFAALTDE